MNPIDPNQTPWPRIGAFSYGFERGRLSQLIDGFRAYGLTAVQLGSGLLDDALESPEQLRETKAELDAAGIEVAGLAGYRNLVHLDSEVRGANIAYLKRCLEVAPELGTTVVATETGSRNPQSEWLPSPDNSTPEAWALVDAALEDLLVVAERHGAIIALEGYVNNVLQTSEELAALLDRFPTKHLQVVLDPFNYLSKDRLADAERVVVDFLDRFADRFVIAHLKDVGPDGAEIDTPEFGAGVFPFPPYFDFLRRRRPDLAVILEHLPFDHVPAAIDRIHQIAGIAR